MSDVPPPDPATLRDNPVAIAKYLTEVLRKNELVPVLIALKNVMRAQNVKAMAENAGLRRDRLYKTFGGDIDPQLGRVIALFEGLDVCLAVNPLPPKTKPPRAKLGRRKKAETPPGS
jgi:probable addiction module antidote protein